jgi:regulator of sirC expression with transglutaminase-like and TPR domain
MLDKEIKVLINLLEDPDKEVFHAVSEKITDRGLEAVPSLEKAWELSLNQEVQEKIEDLIHLIQFNHVKQELREWLETGSRDILFGAYVVAKYQYPDLYYSELDAQIEAFKKAAWLELHDNLTALEKVRILNHILFATQKLSRNSTNFYSPRNSFINQVLETKKGNPISLSIIYSAVAQKLKLPIYGVNLPLNYILAYQDSYYKDDPNGIFFYINPYNNGNVLSRKEIDKFLSEQNIEPKEEFYIPCHNEVTIERMLRNLHFSYEKMGYADKTLEIAELLGIVRSYRNQ